MEGQRSPRCPALSAPATDLVRLALGLAGGNTMVDTEAGSWLTYAEAAALLGCTPEAVRQRARRQKWSRRTPNAYGGQAQILVPDDADVRPRPAPTAVHTGDSRGTPTDHMNGHDRADTPLVQAFDRAVATLRDQLEHERTRADRADHQVQALRYALDDAKTAERVAAMNAAALLTIEAERRAWGLWRRLAWAISRR
jgi:hypothetical protein